MAKTKIDINNADHPSRKKAIEIMEYVAEYIGLPEVFDCSEVKAKWFEVEDKLTHIIEGIE